MGPKFGLQMGFRHKKRVKNLVKPTVRRYKKTFLKNTYFTMNTAELHEHRRAA